jgi:hypothetical protein
MRLRITEGGDETGADATVVDATPTSIRAALFPAELWYGTEVQLESEDGETPWLNVVSVANAYIGPDDAGEFFLGLVDAGVYYSAGPEHRFPRAEVLEYCLRFVVGDRAWLDEHRWIARNGPREGQPRGREQPGR